MFKSIVTLILFSLSSFFLFAKELPILHANSVDSIYVSKAKKKLFLYANGKMVKSYNISIGANPIGHKRRQGDNKTPEGLYTIHDKNDKSSYYKNLGISYPNAKDRRLAKDAKLKPGGDIKIHGYADQHGSTRNRVSRYEYTWGCIAVNNKEMDEIFTLVKLGAHIYISPN